MNRTLASQIDADNEARIEAGERDYAARLLGDEAPDWRRGSMFTEEWNTDREGNEIRDESIVWVTFADGSKAQGFVSGIALYSVRVVFPNGGSTLADVENVVLAGNV